MNSILDARENRANHIKELMAQYKYKTVVIMKANVPGIDKNPGNMVFICRLFFGLMSTTFNDKMIAFEQIKSNDGDYMYFIINEEGNVVKEKTILIEETNSLGRLIDIDVYNEIAITRSDLECAMRKCLICDEYAHVCVRSHAHSSKEVTIKIQEIINEYLTEVILSKTIACIYLELELYPKFGLVSSHDSGCHKDMNFDTFIKSIFAIKPFLREYINYGINNEKNPVKLQEIGLKAEKAMFEATNQVNTHKGLIFILGLLLPSITKAIINQKDTIFLKSEIKNIAEIVIGDYYENLSNKKTKSHGDEIYLKHGIKGVRGEALGGLSLIFDSPSYSEKPNSNVIYEYLIYFMSKLDDTVIVHKTDISTLNEVKETFTKIVESGGYTNNEQLINKLSKEYKKRNISPGGSADLLVAKMIFEELKYLICTPIK